MAKAIKVRPYRVDYFNHAELEGAKALLRSEMTRAATSAEAKADFAAEGRTIVKAARYYKKLTAKPKRVSVSKLMSPRKAAALLKAVEALSYSITFHYVDTVGNAIPVAGDYTLLPSESSPVQEVEVNHEVAQELMKEDLYDGNDEPAPTLSQLSGEAYTVTPACDAPEPEDEPECCNAGPAPTFCEAEPSCCAAGVWIAVTLVIIGVAIVVYCVLPH